MIKKIKSFINDILEANRFIENHDAAARLRSKVTTQYMVSIAFFLLSIANIIAKSYVMLILTVAGCFVNLLFAYLAKKFKKAYLCSISSVSTCSVLFAFFVIYGGNDGFACLWVVLLPFLSMVVMNLVVGFVASLFFQGFLMIVFWTPVKDMLFYHYNEQFCLRFPLFFLITFLLGLLLTVSLKKSEYNECKHLLELEELSEAARNLARTDYLTKLANRLCAYEEFDAKYTDEGVPHCIVMGDIDYFKKVNDDFGHEFGDEVLTIFADYINTILPQDYLKSRWGGEEFLFAANATMSDVYANVEKLRESIGSHTFYCEGTPVHITITFGIAEYYGKNDITMAIDKADDRLYIGKKASRNCTVITG